MVCLLIGKIGEAGNQMESTARSGTEECGFERSLEIRASLIAIAPQWLKLLLILRQILHKSIELLRAVWKQRQQF
jgi:hypothetical protein